MVDRQNMNNEPVDPAGHAPPDAPGDVPRARRQVLVITAGVVVVLLIVIALIVLFSAGGCSETNGQRQAPPPARPTNPAELNQPQPPYLADGRLHVDLGGATFVLDLALNDLDRARGLMHVRRLKSYRGMIFVFPDERPRTFYMKNTLIDLDILFLDRHGTIVTIDTMHTDHAPSEKPHDTSRSDGPARFVIELPAGTTDKLGLEVGQTVELPLERLKRMAR